jgi:UDP-N-acetylglucosamine 2-epimerase
MSPKSSPIKILTILGARPQFIEAATVSCAISLKNEIQIISKKIEKA